LEACVDFFYSWWKSHPEYTHWKEKRREEHFTYYDYHDDTCGVCSGGGNLFCCDFCNKAFHLQCLGLKDSDVNMDAEWCCPTCQEVLDTPLARVQAKSFVRAEMMRLELLQKRHEERKVAEQRSAARLLAESVRSGNLLGYVPEDMIGATFDSAVGIAGGLADARLQSMQLAFGLPKPDAAIPGKTADSPAGSSDPAKKQSSGPASSRINSPFGDSSANSDSDDSSSDDGRNTRESRRLEAARRAEALELKDSWSPEHGEDAWMNRARDDARAILARNGLLGVDDTIPGDLSEITGEDDSKLEATSRSKAADPMSEKQITAMFHGAPTPGGSLLMKGDWPQRVSQSAIASFYA